MSKLVSVIIRTTEACNLSCRYCYVKPSTNNSVLPLDNFEQLIQGLAEADYGLINLYWHGGEPLLAGIGYYRAAVEIARRVAGQHGLIINHKMQTNATLVTKEWVDFFKAHDFKVGLSLDGNQTVNDNNRVHYNGESSFADAIRGIELMRGGGLDTSMLSVLTRKHVGRIDEHYKFVRQLGVRTFKVNPCLINKQENSELQVQPREWGEAMIRLFDLWFNDENPPHNREFQSLVRSMFVGASTLCTHSTTCFANFLSIVPSGEMFPCAKFINEGPQFALGGVSDGMAGILEKYSQLSRDYNDIGCEDCEWKRICYGGCAAYAYWANHDINTRDYLCEGYQMLYAHVYDALQKKLAEGSPFLLMPDNPKNQTGGTR